MIAAIGALLTVSACDSHKSRQATPQAPTTSASEPTLEEQADRYLAIIKPVNEASARFAAQTTGRHDAVTRKQWDSIANPFLAAIKQSNTALLRADWSAPVRPHIRSLVAADAAWIADFSRAYDSLDAGPRVSDDIAASRRAATVVRADLGLPPAEPFNRSGAHL